MTQPYTYLIGWSKQSAYYYGVRFADGCNPNDLWVKYFTSSKTVKEYREKYGEPDIIRIRKVFIEKREARLWEEKVLRRIDASHNDRFLNKANGKAIPIELARHNGKDHPMWGKKHSEETINKMKGPKSEQHKINMRGKRPHVNQTGSNNNAFKGYVITPYGRFESLKDAAAIEGVDNSTIAYRINSGSAKFEEYRRTM